MENAEFWSWTDSQYLDIRHQPYFYNEGEYLLFFD